VGASRPGAADYRVLEVDELGLDAASVGAFIEQHWARKVALSVPRFFDWQFRGAPPETGRNRCLVVVGPRDRLHGFMGVTARSFHLDGRRRLGAELTTWVIDESLRGLGLGKAIVRRLQQSYHAIIGMGISDSALPVYATHGFKYMRYLPRYVRIFDADRVAPISQLDPLGERMIRREPQTSHAKFEAEPIGFRDAAALAEPLYLKFNCTVRDADYLAWRYQDHPFFRYEAFRVGDGRGDAALVVRIDEKGDLRVAHVVDFLGAETSVPAALAFLESLCRERGVALADFYCSADPIGHQFWSHGWFSSVDDFYLQVPNWFYPIDMRTPPTTSLILWARDDVGALIDRSRIYITKGDCDMDRPTLVYLEEHGLAV
jgi:GNAT superfamily N-acetyltransferase